MSACTETLSNNKRSDSAVTTVKAAPLTATAFAPYGNVIQTEGANHFDMNDGGAERYYDLANIDVGEETGGRVVVSLATGKVLSSLPHTVTRIERHPLGSQAFVPLNDTPIVVAVAAAGAPPAADNIRAFISNGRQGINYHRGIWHMPAIFLRWEQTMLIIDRGCTNDNCDIYDFTCGGVTITT